MSRLRFVFSGFLFLLVCHSALGQTSSVKDQEQAQQAVQGFFQGFSDRDFQKIMQHATPDMLLLEDGIVWNTDSIRIFIDRIKGRDLTRENHFDFISTRVQGNTAWIAYRNRADFKQQDKSQSVNWLESVVLVKERGQWRIQLMHSTVLLPKKKK